MTIDDAFDARLKAAFAAAEPEPNEAFVERVTSRLARSDRRRMLIIGGAGAGGSTIASTQLEALFRQAESSTGVLSWLGGGESVLLAVIQPETLAAITLALMVSAVAYFLPSRR
jgi:hypothetical protein